MAGHPWVYRDHIPPRFRAEMGSWVEVRAGKFEGYALWDRLNPIALRIYSRSQIPDARWVRERVQEAYELRAPIRATDTSCYRLLFGEGDGIPGIVVDLYDRFAVLAAYAASVEVLVPLVEQAVRDAVPGLQGVVRKTDGGLEVLWGRAPASTQIVTENGLRLHADLAVGQKTGLFLDHRDNRSHVESLAESKSVLNLFAYSGAFSLYALRGGATRVVSVDVSPGAMASASANVELNGFDASRHEAVVADVFEYLERSQDTFDVVICDPPSFARSRDQLRKALRAYARLNRWATSAVEPGGVLAAASCTAQVSPPAFREVVAEAAKRARRRLQVFRDAGHALDHPIALGHPEGRYLKYLACRVLPRS